MIDLILIISTGFLLCGIMLETVGNRDIFSPLKFYYLYILCFFNDIYLNYSYDYTAFVYWGYLFFCLTGFLMTVYELFITAGIRKKWYIENSSLAFTLQNHSRVFLVIWLLSLIPLGLLFHLINSMGGLSNYIARNRLEFIFNNGISSTIIRFLPALNVVYALCLLFCRLPHRLFWWGIFFFHLLLTCLVGLSSGGRTRTILPVITLMILYHYLVKRLSYKVVLPVLLIGIPFLITFGVVRGSMYGGLESLVDSIKHVSIEDIRDFGVSKGMGSYGTEPLMIISEDHFSDYQYGKTYLSCITNFIPRSIWPGKPDSGGVVLTKFYQKETYTGTSHISTGAIVEGILNWGYAGGVILGGAIFITIGIATCHFYRSFLQTLSANSPQPGKIFRYSFFYVAIGPFWASLTSGEFTTCFFSTVLIPILLFQFTLIFLHPQFRRESEK